MTAVLCFTAARFTYPGAALPAIDAVSLTVKAGEGIGLFGANGAGKTTLARLAMALLHPQGGSVVVGGRDTRGLEPEDLAGQAGFLFQQPEAQLFETTVRAELAFGPRCFGWPTARIEQRVDAVLAELDLEGVAATHPYDLPAPRRRLVALGTALMVDPVLLILDEPTAGLDRAARAAVHRIVRGRRAAGCAVLAVTHDAEFAAEALDRGVVLTHGRISADAPLADLFDGVEPVLALPPHVDLARRLSLEPASLRMSDAALALARRCRGSS